MRADGVGRFRAREDVESFLPVAIGTKLLREEEFFAKRTFYSCIYSMCMCTRYLCVYDACNSLNGGTRIAARKCFCNSVTFILNVYVLIERGCDPKVCTISNSDQHPPTCRRRVRALNAMPVLTELPNTRAVNLLPAVLTVYTNIIVYAMALNNVNLINERRRMINAGYRYSCILKNNTPAMGEKMLDEVIKLDIIG